MDLSPVIKQSLRLMVVGAFLLVPLARAELPPITPGFTVQTWIEGADDPANYNYSGGMAQTPDGYLWMGSPNGLIRFDGIRFVTLTTNDTPALGDNRISRLFVDDQGVLWAGTQGGTLSRREDGVFSPVRVDERLRGLPIESLGSAGEGELWLGTTMLGLVRMTPGDDRFSSFTGEMSSRTARSLIRVSQDEWWGGTDYRLIKLDGNSDQAELLGLPHAAPIFYAQAPGRVENSFWVATSRSVNGLGARIFEVKDGRYVRELAPYPWPEESVRSSVNCLIEDSRGRIWVSTSLNGVYFWELNRGWTELKSPNNRSLIRITQFYFDAEDRLWMRDLDGRLYSVTERRVATVPLQTDLSRVQVTTVRVTGDGALWIGTEDDGVFRFQDGAFTPVGDASDVPRVTVLFEDREANLFVGTWNGLFRWDGSRFQPVAADTIKQIVRALHEDRHGNLWAGNGPEVVRIGVSGDVRSYGKDAGLGKTPDPERGHRFVEGITEDAGGTIYVARGQHGLFRLTGDRFERVDASMPHEPDGRMLPDEDGSVWVIAHGDGLFRLNDVGGLQFWNHQDGLPSTYLSAVIADDADNLWFGSVTGIFGCSKRSLIDYQRGKTPPISFWRLGEADGMNGPWVAGGGQAAVARSADGRLWFPNGNGVAVFDPAAVAQNWHLCDPVVEELMVDDEIQLNGAADGAAQLTSGFRHLKIHFTCPNSRSPETLRFRYRLEGLDDEWTEAVTERTAHFRQLKPGDYAFRIQATSDSSEWRESKVPLAFTVAPRWWEETSVRLLGFLGITGLLMGTAWRAASVKNRRELETLELKHARDELTHLQRADSIGQLASALAHELNQPLGAILRNAEAGELYLQQSSPDIGELQAILADIRQDDRRAGDVIDRMRSLLKRRDLELEPLSLAALCDQVALFAHAELQAKRVEPQVDVPADLPLVRGDRVQLQQVLLNLCINALHAMEDTPPEQRRLAVSAHRVDSRTVEVVVCDSGHGIPADKRDRIFQPFFSTKAEGLGMGLAISQTIVTSHGGRIWAENNPDGGATFRFTLKVAGEGGSSQ